LSNIFFNPTFSSCAENGNLSLLFYLSFCFALQFFFSVLPQYWINNSIHFKQPIEDDKISSPTLRNRLLSLAK